MHKMIISLPEAMKSFVDEQVANRDYVRELISKDQERLQLRSLLLAGAESTPAAMADSAYFAALRDRISDGKRA